ncbi:MAG: hypothetical protein WA919_21960 [Coleofasciculaceae cyanobacterium]
MQKINLWREEAVEADGWTTVSIITERSNRVRIPLWYKIPSEYNSLITESCDPFVIATVLFAMTRSFDLVVHGTVSPSLLRNLEEFQAAWSSWRPGVYQPIEIRADVEQEELRRVTSKQAITAFSGGVDSSLTVWRHQTGHCGRRELNIKAGLMVHGFDIPLAKQEVFERATTKAQTMLNSLGVKLIPMVTNFRELPLNWEDAFGTAAASCLMLLQKRYSVGLIASSFPYQALSFPYGSNPVTDRLLSSKSFQIVHDGAEFNRIEKMRQLKAWPECLENLRVCWQGEEADKNCGRCEKCVRTILIGRIAGMSLPACFTEDISDQEIENIEVTEGPLTEMERVLDAAKAADITDSWVSALEKCIRRNKDKVKRQELKAKLKKQFPLAVLERRRRKKTRPWMP